MTAADRCFLCSRLVADGISQQGFLLKFLPLFFTNLQASPCLTLTDGFSLLIETVGALEEHIRQSKMFLTGTTVIDIFEMAKLASKVLTSRMFQQSTEFFNIFSGSENGKQVFRIAYSREFWKLVSMPPELTTGHMMNHVERCVLSLV